MDNEFDWVADEEEYIDHYTSSISYTIKQKKRLPGSILQDKERNDLQPKA